VAVVYTHFPHYRAPVFHALAQTPEFDYSFFYDPVGIAPSIKNGDLVADHVPMRVISFGPVLVQPGAISLAARGDFDVFIFLGNPFIVTTWLAAIIARLRRRPVLFWTHGWLRRETGIKAAVRKTFYRLANGLLVYGERAKEIGAASGYPRDKIYVVYNSLDYESQKTVRREVMARQSVRQTYPPRFLTVARLVEGLDLELAFEALQILRDEMAYSVELVVVGDGPLREALEDRIAQLDLPVRMLGAVYEEARLAELFLDSVAVVSPGKVGLLAMHALGYGIPVITHDDFDWQMPEVEAIENGVTGAFFRRGDAGDLAKKMRQCAQYDVRADAGEAAIVRIEADYTPARQVERIGAAIRSLLQQPKKPRKLNI